MLFTTFIRTVLPATLLPRCKIPITLLLFLPPGASDLFGALVLVQIPRLAIDESLIPFDLTGQFVVERTGVASRARCGGP